MSSRTNLPDTPLNRRLIRRLAEQDQRGRALQRSLFHELSEADEPTTPLPTDPTSYSTSTATFKLQADENFKEGDPIPDPNAADGLIISKMISGASSHRVVSSADVFKTLVAQVNIKTEFPQSCDQKKNRSVSVLSFVDHIKTSERFQWPAAQETFLSTTLSASTFTSTSFGLPFCFCFLRASVLFFLPSGFCSLLSSFGLLFCSFFLRASVSVSTTAFENVLSNKPARHSAESPADAQHSPTILATQVNNTAAAAVSANCAGCENRFEYDAAFDEERKLHMPKNCKGCILLKKQRRAAAEATVMTLESAEDEFPGRRPAYFCDDNHTDSDDY
jgi:hypothetical protein